MNECYIITYRLKAFYLFFSLIRFRKQLPLFRISGLQNVGIANDGTCHTRAHAGVCV